MLHLNKSHFEKYSDSIILSVLLLYIILIISILLHIIIESLYTRIIRNIKFNILLKLFNRYLKFKYSIIDLFLLLLPK